MIKKRWPVLVLALGIQTGLSGQAERPRRSQTITSSASVILVDVVVRDRRGEPITDLTQADFELLEDGVPQPIGSFAPMFERSAEIESVPPTRTVPGAAATPATALRKPTNPGVTALVFDRLRPEARRRAAQAARSYLGAKEESADFIAVFGIDLSMTPFVPFTRNALALRKALDAMVQSASAGFNSRESQQAIADATRLAAAASTAGSATGDGIARASPDAQFAVMQAAMMAKFEAMERDQQGYATTNGLLAIVEILARIPGRKSIVLFSEGIAIPPAVHRFYLGVIDAANRANVSIYAMDAVGLRAESAQAKIRDGVNLQAGVGINTGYSADGGGDPYTQGLERNEYGLRSDPAYGLDGLARSTGGLFFNNTNNLSPAFERIESDQRHYYLLGYTPSNGNYDGRFRKIEVKVKRASAAIAARRGYFAVRNTGGMAINQWEAPALAALEHKPVSNAFPVRAAALLFPERGRPGLVPVVVDLKTTPLTFTPAPDGKSYSSDFTVLVQFLDDQNKVARRVSQHYDIRGPIEQIDRATQGDVIFYRESELAPGVYTVETIVHDAPSGKSSVRLSTVEVPKHAEGQLRMSSLVLVSRSESVPSKDRSAPHPLVVGDVLLRPNLGDPVTRVTNELGFYFAVYPAPAGAAPQAQIELLLNGAHVAQLPMPMAATDPTGRVQQIGRLPITGLAPGTYELRAVVTQGHEQIARSTIVRIVD